MIFQVLDSFGGDYGIETLLRPGKRSVKVCVLKGCRESSCRLGIDVRANGIKATLSKRESQCRGAAAWCVQDACTARKAERRQVIQYGALNHSEIRGVHILRQLFRTSS